MLPTAVRCCKIELQLSTLPGKSRIIVSETQGFVVNLQSVA